MTQMTSPRRLARRLADVDLTDIAEVGGKAAVLGALRRAGFPVPDGFVLTAGPAATTELSDAEIEQVITAARALGGPVAVRSSGIAEDGEQRSYAGQFDTVLDVGAADLIAAVRACLASASSDRARAYDSAGDMPMSILVQRMVPADAAGVAFTADPVTGDPEPRVNAGRGLGDRLVSGEVDADEWVIRDGAALLVNGEAGAISAGQALAIAELAGRAAEHLGADQDIEWAIAGSELFLLQARPITALPVPVPVDPPPGYWLRETIHAPDPVSPMMESIWRLNDGVRGAAEEYGFLITPSGVQIGGWAYSGVAPVGAPPGRPAPPPWVLAVLARIVPAVRRRVRQCRTAVRTDRPGRNVERWFTEWRPQLADRIHTLRDVDLTALDDERCDAISPTPIGSSPTQRTSTSWSTSHTCSRSASSAWHVRTCPAGTTPGSASCSPGCPAPPPSRLTGWPTSPGSPPTSAT